MALLPPPDCKTKNWREPSVISETQSVKYYVVIIVISKNAAVKEIPLAAVLAKLIN